MILADILKQARTASRALALTPDGKINSVLNDLADAAILETPAILEANMKDLEKTAPDNPMTDRLRLDENRIRGIASDIRNVASLKSPLGITLESTVRPNGMEIRKVSVPFGVIGIIYEARPNVSFDVFSLCIKSGNSCVLKGGSDARNSNEAIAAVIKKVLRKNGLDENIITLLPPDRNIITEMLNAVGYIDLVIPRGSKGLIDFVRNNSKVPVIETGAGICHTYFDRDGDSVKGEAVITNAKTRRVSVCNALDCLIIHRDRLSDLPELCRGVAEKDVVVYADAPAFSALKGRYPDRILQHADEKSFGTEFLSYKMAVKTAENFDDAVAHITEYSSGHSEAIITENAETAALFQKKVDAACVYVNVSTAFTDGAQFGFGAEIGISTQKLHARGPMALRELTSYKYLINGDGQIRLP